MVREILEPKTEEVTTGEGNCIMSSFIICALHRIVGTCSTHGTNVVRKPEAKGLLGSPRRRREDNIKIILKEIECEAVNSSHVAQDVVWKRGFYEHSNEILDSTGVREFLGQSSEHFHLRKDSDP
jgi:hypothetical protein